MLAVALRGFVASLIVAGVTARSLTDESLSNRAAQHEYQLHERRDVPSRAWVKRDRVTPDAIVPVQVGLTQQNLHRGYDHLLEVSDPDSPTYSNHWTEDEVHDVFAPHADTVDAVRSWLVGSGVDVDSILHSANRGWLHFNTTASHLESLIKAELHEHEHVSTGAWSLGTDEYHLPAHVREHIDYITPGVKHRRLTKRTVPRRPRHNTLCRKFHPQKPVYGNLSDCDRLVRPECIAALYRIPEPPHRVAKGNALGIFETGDAYSQVDLDLGFKNFTPYIPQGTHPTVKSIDGGVAPVSVDDAGGESDLDLQIAYPIVYPQKIVVYQVDDPLYADGTIPTLGFGNTFLDALDGSYCNYTAYGVTGNDPKLDPVYPNPAEGGYKGQLMCGTYKPTNVISISYGTQEIDLPASYQKRQCNEFMKLGLRGISVVVASGDTGVAGYPDDFSADNGCLGKDGKVFNPPNPNTCPYVTNVGATMIVPNNTVFDAESAAFGFFGNSDGTKSLFTSSGGFSNIYPVPKYQKKAVSDYFRYHNPPYPYYKLLDGFKASKAGKGVYNRIGHGVPDVAANGLQIAAYQNGQLYTFGGASAAAPIFASILTRINDNRLLAGKRTIGFVNPALYAHPEMLTDIKNGTNPGCGTDGFKAVSGWDPVSGLGTPDYPRMERFFCSLR